MKAKMEEKEKAIEMRKEGLSIIEIAKTLGVTKSSVSVWVRAIPQPEKFTVEFLAKRKQERLERIKKVREERKEANHPSDEMIDLHLENVKKTGEPLLSRRLLTGDGKWMIPAPTYYTGKKYIKNKYVYEHRIIVEKFLGRLLNKNETVYHLNGNKLNNKLENLEIRYREFPESSNTPNILKVHSRGNYKSVVISGHPYADKRDRVLLHRYIMEQHIGRYLTPDEIVHHKDENTKNNDVMNLEITTIAEHCRHHHKPSNVVELICPECEKKFIKLKRYIRQQKNSFCSISCSTTHYFKHKEKGPIAHGTTKGYNRGCKCTLCKKANSEDVKLRRKIKRDVGQSG